MSANVAVNDDPVIGEDLAFSDILDKLEMGLQIHIEGNHGRVGFFGDFTYLNTSDSVTLDAASNQSNAEVRSQQRADRRLCRCPLHGTPG